MEDHPYIAKENIDYSEEGLKIPGFGLITCTLCRHHLENMTHGSYCKIVQHVDHLRGISAAFRHKDTLKTIPDMVENPPTS